MASKPQMEHRHFVLVADAIASMNIDYKKKRLIATHIAHALKHTNTNFMVERFISAAMGVPVTSRDKVR